MTVVERMRIRLETVQELQLPAGTVGSVLCQGVVLGLRMALRDALGDDPRDVMAGPAPAPSPPATLAAEPERAVPERQPETDAPAPPPAAEVEGAPQGDAATQKRRLAPEERERRRLVMAEMNRRRKQPRETVAEPLPEPAPPVTEASVTEAAGQPDAPAAPPAVTAPGAEQDRVLRLLSEGRTEHEIAAGLMLPLVRVQSYGALHRQRQGAMGAR